MGQPNRDDITIPVSLNNKESQIVVRDGLFEKRIRFNGQNCPIHTN